jgi:hypothetical protein
VGWNKTQKKRKYNTKHEEAEGGGVNEKWHWRRRSRWQRKETECEKERTR